MDYWYYGDEMEINYTGRYETEVQFDQTIDYIEQHKNSERPFFLMVWPHPPHPPYRPSQTPPGYLDMVPEELTWRENVPGEGPGSGDGNPRTSEQMRCYLAMVKHIDDNLGRLLAYLEDSGIMEETMIVFGSDHGEMHGSHGRINKMVPYREAVMVPLIFYAPGRIPAGVTSDAIFTPLEHYPTLCGLTGVSPPEGLEGVDMSGEIMGTGNCRREDALMMNYTSHWNHFVSQNPEEAMKAGYRCWPEWRGVFTGRYTYTRWLDGSEELYDNNDDPYQLHNLAEDNARQGLLGDFRTRLRELLAEAHDDFPPGTAYQQWYDSKRRLLRTALGPVERVDSR
jgi:arylsulfatase A-like enzyme